jgi:hypothetical protein
MGDPSALINQMLRYPGNRAFAVGLVRWLADDAGGASRGGRLFILANAYSESGSFAGVGGLRGEIEDRLKSAEQELGKVFQGGLTGMVGLSLAALVAFGVGVWTTSVASRVYRRRTPSFARPIPLVAQGGVAGRAAMLTAPTTPRALAVLELKSALEEALAHELGAAGSVPAAALLDEVRKKGGLDEATLRALKGALIEMANLETSVLARQPQNVKRDDVLRLSRVVFDVVARVRGRRAAGERAA